MIQQQEKKATQNKIVLAHLEEGKGISTFMAFKKHNITRLSARIKDLRDMGHVIYGKMIDGKDSKYKMYYMADSKLFKLYGESL